MGYGDLQFFDLIIFAGVAVFLIYRLRSVLGKRSGFEKKNLVEDPAHKKTNNNSKPIPKLNDSEKKLSLIYKTLDDFDHRAFLENAKFAFETIINAFNSGDKKTLKNLLTKNVYQSFERAIEQEKNNPNFQFYSLVVDSVEETNIDKNIASITLKITSEQFKDNDENTIIKKQDTWTFQKEINNKSPIWLLSST